MVYLIVPNGDKTYKVINIINGEVHATSTTLRNAQKQIRLMQMKDSSKHKNY